MKELANATIPVWGILGFMIHGVWGAAIAVFVSLVLCIAMGRWS